MAVLPGVALDDLWRVLAVGENSLLLVGALVALSSVLSISAVLLVSISSRRREFAVLRAVGARPQGLLLMLVLESVFVSLAGMALGLCAHQLLIWASADRLRTLMGISLSPLSIPAEGWLSLAAVMLMAVLASLLPAVRAYRLSLQDGLNPPYA
jgi:putative ABC transport system permease protein